MEEKNNTSGFSVKTYIWALFYCRMNQHGFSLPVKVKTNSPKKTTTKKTPDCHQTKKNPTRTKNLKQNHLAFWVVSPFLLYCVRNSSSHPSLTTLPREDVRQEKGSSGKQQVLTGLFSSSVNLTWLGPGCRGDKLWLRVVIKGWKMHLECSQSGRYQLTCCWLFLVQNFFFLFR